MNSKSVSLKGDLFLAVFALFVVGGLCVKGMISFGKCLEIKHSSAAALENKLEK